MHIQVMNVNSGATVTTVSQPVTVELVEGDITGAALDEPLATHNIAALRWWLQCRGIKPVSSWRKQQLISRLVPSLYM